MRRRRWPDGVEARRVGAIANSRNAGVNLGDTRNLITKACGLLKTNPNLAERMLMDAILKVADSQTELSNAELSLVLARSVEDDEV